jgi:hypothetical protein
MDQSPREANSRSAGHYPPVARGTNNAVRPTCPTSNPQLHILQILNIYFNIILQPTPSFPKPSCPFKFFD